MPYSFERKKIKMPRRYDRRVKLTDKQRREILELHAAGWPTRKIARRFADHCSRRLIMFIIDPAKHAANLKARHALLAACLGRYKYDKPAWAEKMREHRCYKYKIITALGLGKLHRMEEAD